MPDSYDYHHHTEPDHIEVLLQEEETRIEKYVHRVNQLFRIAKAQAAELETERNRHRRTRHRLARRDQEIQDLKERLKAAQHSTDDEKLASIAKHYTAQIEDERAKRQHIEAVLNQTQHQLDQKKAELERVERDRWIKEAFDLESPEQLAVEERDKRIQAEQKLQQVRQNLEQTKARLTKIEQNVQTERQRRVNAELKIEEIKDASTDKRIRDEKDLRRKAEKNFRNMRRKFNHANREVKHWRSVARQKAPRTIDHTNLDPEPLKSAIIPKIKLVRDSISHLESSRDQISIIYDLHRLNNNPKEMRGERIGGSEWMEIRPTREERIYYKRSPKRDKHSYSVLLGDKNSQPRDIDWLKRN